MVLGPYTTELRRPPSLKGKDGAPSEVVRLARDAIERGRVFTVRPDVRSATVHAFVSALVGCVLAAAGVVAFVSGLGYRLGVLLLAGAVGAGCYVAFLLRGGSVGPARLWGTAVRGSGRISTELWTQAVRDVEVGVRSEDTLPELHRTLMRVTRAEDKVNRLVSRAKYDADQSEADVARAELGVLVAEARELLGLPVEPSVPPPYLTNRWGESAEASEGEPANPDDLR